MRYEKLKTPAIGIVAGFINGLLGSGGGTLIVPSLEFFQKMESRKAHATAIAIILPITAISTFIYLLKGSLHWPVILLVGIGSITGSLLGAFLLNKIPSHLLSKIFGFVLMIAAVRMLFL